MYFIRCAQLQSCTMNVMVFTAVLLLQVAAQGFHDFENTSVHWPDLFLQERILFNAPRIEGLKISSICKEKGLPLESMRPCKGSLCLRPGKLACSAVGHECTCQEGLRLGDRCKEKGARLGSMEHCVDSLCLRSGQFACDFIYEECTCQRGLNLTRTCKEPGVYSDRKQVCMDSFCLGPNKVSCVALDQKCTCQHGLKLFDTCKEKGASIEKIQFCEFTLCLRSGKLKCNDVDQECSCQQGLEVNAPCKEAGKHPSTMQGCAGSFCTNFRRTHCAWDKYGCWCQEAIICSGGGLIDNCHECENEFRGTPCIDNGIPGHCLGLGCVECGTGDECTNPYVPNLGCYSKTRRCSAMCLEPDLSAFNLKFARKRRFLGWDGFSVPLICASGIVGKATAVKCDERGSHFHVINNTCAPVTTTTTPSARVTVPIAANTTATVLSTSAAITTITNGTTTTPSTTTTTAVTTTVSATSTTTTASPTTTSTTGTITTTATLVTIITTPATNRSAATSISTAATTTSTAAITTSTASPATTATTTSTATTTTSLFTYAASATTTAATNNTVTKAVTASTATGSITITTTTLATDFAGCSSRTGCNGTDVSTETATHKPTTSFTPTGAAQPRWVTWLIIFLAIDAAAFLLCLVAMRIYPNYAVDLHRRLAVPMRCFCGKKGNEDTQEHFCEEDPAIANMEGLQTNYNISGHKAMLPVATTNTCVNRSTSPSHEHHLDMRDGQATKRSFTRSAPRAKYSMDNAVSTCQPQFGHLRESLTLTVSDRVVPDPFCGVSNEAPIEEKSANDRSGCPPSTPSRHSTTRTGNWQETS